MPAYKQMQAAFTKKTQEIAEQRRQAEEWKAQAERFSKYEQHVPILEEMLASQAQVQQNNSVELKALEETLRQKGYGEEAIELVKATSQHLINTLTQKEKAKEEQIQQQRQYEQFTKQLEEAAKVDPRLTDTSLEYTSSTGQKITFGQLVEGIVMTDPNWRQDTVGATKRAIEYVDALIGKAKTDGKQELSNSARGKALKFPSTSSSPKSTADLNRAVTFAEAAKEARQELGI